MRKREVLDIGVIVFAYNRSMHLQKVLDGLRKNKEISKLYIFQDGLKSKEHFTEWIKTYHVIKNIEWCKVIYKQSAYNKGLAASIVDGITEVFQENDAVVVLEDDCVPTANFISFMQQCIEKYQDDKRIYSVSGYSWPMMVEKNGYDVYGCGRICTWGWGTWKDRWKIYSIDNDIMKRIKEDRTKSRNLAIWGNDCEKMFLDRIAGRNDSWAIYWGLKVIENAGICINPYCSLIQNIGMDGTGTHCGRSDRFQVKLSGDLKQCFELPNEVLILDSTEKMFAEIYGSYTAINKENEFKDRILVYGLGNFYFQYEKQINEDYYVKAFVDKNKRGWFGGKKIIKIYEIDQYKYDKILIMIQNLQECINIVRELMPEGISVEKISLGHSFYGRYSKCIDNFSILSDGSLSITVGKVTQKIRTMDEFNSAYENLVEKDLVPLDNSKVI